MKSSTVVGGRIKALRKAKGWTQEQLAEASSLHYSYIGGVERGERNISLDTLEKIVAALQVPPMELFRFESGTDVERDHQTALDELMTLMGSREIEELEMITKINRDIFKAIDTKRG